MDNIRRFIITLFAALCGAFLFQLLRIPVPFLLGPMITLLILAQSTKMPLFWPKQIRNYSLIVIGYTLGTAFTLPILKEIPEHLPTMIIVTIIMFICSILFALLLAKFGRVNFPTALTSSVPGGLTQILALAEEMKGINLTVVAFFHTMRVFMIVLLVPIIVHLPAIQQQIPPIHIDSSLTNATSMPLIIRIIVYAVSCYLAYRAFKKLHIPAPTILGPIVITACIHLIFNVEIVTLPSWFMAICQLVVGTHIGLMLRPQDVPRKTVVLPLAIISSMSLIGIALVMSMTIMPSIEKTSIATGFLSLAPGGIDQMGIIGHEIGADLSMITTYQVFRMLFVYFCVPPFIALAIKRFHQPKKD